MKIKIILLLLSIFLIIHYLPGMNETISIIPRPLLVKENDGQVTLTDSTRIIISSKTAQLQNIAGMAAGRIAKITGRTLEISTSPKKKDNSIFLLLDPKLGRLGKEGYELSAAGTNVTIRSAGPAGLFYGVQSLLQLLPSVAPKGGGPCMIPSVTIEDRPRYSWRGMHLDVGRHFAPVDFVKKYIDLLASYKMNTFHWHLTEDQGWRIEIKKYPRLTEIGSRRAETNGDGVPHGGYYTQDEVKEVVKYAGERFVTVVPEIEMPGHSLAALAAYPELSCTGGPFNVGSSWGVFEDVYCAGDEKTFIFLKDVLNEVIPLFPGRYFHIGGDESPKARWKACPKCQSRIKRNKLGNSKRLQSYFVRRIERFLRSKGKRAVGWDEILEGGLAPGATVMSWRGTKGGIAAAKANHDVVMSPTSFCYFDYYQADPEGEPKAIGGFLPLEKVYEFEPTPRGLKPKQAKRILGAQGNVWTEYMPNTGHVEYMVLPRMLAMSEVVWSDRSRRDLADFKSRLAAHYPRLAESGYNFRLTK